MMGEEEFYRLIESLPAAERDEMDAWHQWNAVEWRYFRWQRKQHATVFNLSLRYCLTPPVSPPFRREWGTKTFDKLAVGGDMLPPPAKRLCIACGRRHVTSEDCGREPPEAHVRENSPEFWPLGYRLAASKGLRRDDDVDDWD